MARTPAYITLKDQKESFQENISCRQINLCKSKIGKLSKQLLEKINNQLLEKLNVNQWRDNNKVIDWLVNLKDIAELQVHSVRHRRILSFNKPGNSQ